MTEKNIRKVTKSSKILKNKFKDSEIEIFQDSCKSCFIITYQQTQTAQQCRSASRPFVIGWKVGSLTNQHAPNHEYSAGLDAYIISLAFMVVLDKGVLLIQRQAIIYTPVYSSLAHNRSSLKILMLWFVSQELFKANSRTVMAKLSNIFRYFLTGNKLCLRKSDWKHINFIISLAQSL